MCEFESFSAWPLSSHCPLNMEAYTSEPANQSHNNAQLTMHTQSGINMYAHTQALTAQLHSEWQAALKQFQVLLN